MKVRKMLLREETEKVLHTKSNGDRLVVNSSGHGYSAYTKNDVHIGHIEAVDDAAAIAEFSKKEPKYESMNEDYLNSPEYRIQRYEDDIPDLFHKVHDGYMNGMVNAKAYGDVLAKIYSLLEELDFIEESLKEGYMDAHDGMNHVDTLDMMAALKAVVREYGHMELVTPIVCKLHDDEHGRRLELLSKHIDEGFLVPDQIVGDITLDASGQSVGILGGTGGEVQNDNKAVQEDTDDGFMDAEKLDMDDLDSPVGKEEDIEFVMSEYIPDSLLIEFVKKIEKNKYLVGVEDEVVTVEFDPNWSEYVYTIEGKGPYSHSSYEFISRDIYDYVMSQRPADAYDDDYEDLSAFEGLNEVKAANTLFGLKESKDLDTIKTQLKNELSKRGLKLNPEHNTIDAAAEYITMADADYTVNQWIEDTKQNYPDHFLDEAFDMSYGIDLDKVRWQVASLLDVEALGEDNWIEFVCDDPRGLMGSSDKTMRFEAIGEDAHKYGFIRTRGGKAEVKFRNGSEAMCNSSQEIARFIAGEFGVSI